MKTKINGIDLHYEIDGTGPVCFVLHGGLGLDHSLYRRSMGPLAESLRLIFVDFRNNGRSEQAPLETVTMEQLADDVVGLADHLQLDDFLVLGHSYGGFVAQELAIRHVDRLRGLILVSTRAGLPGSTEEIERHHIPPRPAGLVELDALPLLNRETTARYWHEAAPYFTNPENIEALRELMSDTLFEGPVRSQGSRIFQTWSTINRLQGIVTPTLIIGGSKDLVSAPGELRRIADQLPNGTLVEIEGANHFPWIEAPETFYETIRYWLEENRLR